MSAKTIKLLMLLLLTAACKNASSDVTNKKNDLETNLDISKSQAGVIRFTCYSSTLYDLTPGGARPLNSTSPFVVVVDLDTKEIIRYEGYTPDTIRLLGKPGYHPSVNGDQIYHWNITKGNFQGSIDMLIYKVPLYGCYVSLTSECGDAKVIDLLTNGN